MGVKLHEATTKYGYAYIIAGLVGSRVKDYGTKYVRRFIQTRGKRYVNQSQMRPSHNRKCPIGHYSDMHGLPYKTITKI